MRRALLLYNPRSGKQRAPHAVELALAELRAAGVEAVAEPTRAAGAAGEQARTAVAAGVDTVVACGGDGTVHDILQGMVGGPGTLGVLPLGTGNALANDLGLARDVPAAARLLAGGSPRPIAVGEIQTSGAPSRYFIVGSGVGCDAHMVYRLSVAFKRRFGMLAYYLESTRQWATHTFPEFRVEYRDLESGAMRSSVATQVLAIRITYFGGMLRRLAPGAALDRNDIRLVVFRTRSRLRYLRYMWNVFRDRDQPTADVDFAYTDRVRCTALPNTPKRPRIYAEADGELLGRLPVEVALSGATVNLLVPEGTWKS